MVSAMSQGPHLKTGAAQPTRREMDKEKIYSESTSDGKISAALMMSV